MNRKENGIQPTESKSVKQIKEVSPAVKIDGQKVITIVFTDGTILNLPNKERVTAGILEIDLHEPGDGYQIKPEIVAIQSQKEVPVPPENIGDEIQVHTIIISLLYITVTNPDKEFLNPGFSLCLWPGMFLRLAEQADVRHTA